MNNRQKAKHFKRLYEQLNKQPALMINYRPYLPRLEANYRIDRQLCEIFAKEHGTSYWEAKDFIAGYYKTEAINNIVSNQIKNIVKDKLKYTCDERGILYTFDMWVE